MQLISDGRRSVPVNFCVHPSSNAIPIVHEKPLKKTEAQDTLAKWA